MWADKVQTMVDTNGIPKGMKQVLEERGINTATLLGPDMKIILANHDDFKSEKTIVENYIINRGHYVHFIPKFHCEMNPIERDTQECIPTVHCLDCEILSSLVLIQSHWIISEIVFVKPGIMRELIRRT